MRGRLMIFGLCGLCIATGVTSLPANAGSEPVPADAKRMSGVTVIPGSTSPERRPIDFQNALPLPLPSADPPGTTGATPVAPGPPGTGGTSSPGSHGSGERHLQVLPK
jgi:hypothetical protein